MSIRYKQFKNVEEACSKIEDLLNGGYNVRYLYPWFVSQHEDVFTNGDDIFEYIRMQGNERVFYREEIFGGRLRIKVKTGDKSLDYVIFRFSKK